MNMFINTLITLVLFDYYNTEVICMPIPQSDNGGFETAISAGITDNKDDCFEAAVNAGVAADEQVGADFKLVGLNSGGVRCKQGKKGGFNVLKQPFHGFAKPDYYGTK